MLDNEIRAMALMYELPKYNVALQFLSFASLLTSLLSFLTSRFAAAVLLLYVGALATLLCAVNAPDDTWVYFRYAMNAIEAGELVFNPGERVEGFSSPLYQFILVGISVVTGSPILSAVLLSAVLLLLVPSVLLALLRRYTTFDPAGAYLTVAILLFSPASMLWAQHLWLDFHLAGLGVLLCFAIYFLQDERPRSRLAAGSLLGLAYIARPEAALVSIVFGLDLAVRHIRNDGTVKDSVLRAAAFFGPLSACILGLAAARYGYYGDLLPNTAYLKITPALVDPVLVKRALFYLWDWARDPSFIASVALFAFLAFARPLGTLRDLYGSGRPLGRHVTLSIALAAAMAIFLAYWMKLGGDRWPLRYFMLFLPALCLAIGLLLSTADPGGADAYGSMEASRPSRAFAAAIAAVMAVSALPTGLQGTSFGGIGPKNLQLAAFGLHLRETFPDDTVVAGFSVGVYPYFSGLPFIDGLGLVDRHIARQEPRDIREEGHTNWDTEYLLARQPDVIVPTHFFNGAGIVLPCLVSPTRQTCLKRAIEGSSARWERDLLLRVLDSDAYVLRIHHFDADAGRRLFGGRLPNKWSPFHGWYFERTAEG